MKTNLFIILILTLLTKSQPGNFPQWPNSDNFNDFRNLPTSPKNLRSRSSYQIKDSSDFENFAASIRNNKNKSSNPPQVQRGLSADAGNQRNSRHMFLYSPMCYWKCHSRYFQCINSFFPWWFCNWILNKCYWCIVSNFFCWSC